MRNDTIMWLIGLLRTMVRSALAPRATKPQLVRVQLPRLPDRR